MKKLLFTAGTVAVLALASCSNDEIDNLNPTSSGLIRYSAVMNSSTRANTYYDASSSSLKDMPDFTVYASESASGNTYIDGDEAKYNKSSDSYTYAQRYWPKCKLDFLAIAGKENKFGTTPALTFSAGTLTVEDASINPDAAKQYDMLYARTNEQENLDQESKDVTFYFRHALAQLNFRFVCANPNLNVKVSEIRLVNIDTKGKVVFDNETKEQYIDNASVLDDATYGNLCTWSDKGNLNNNGNDVTIDYVTRRNWAYTYLSTPETSAITLNSTPQQLKGDVAVPDAQNFLPKENIEVPELGAADYGEKLQQSSGALAQWKKDCEAMAAGKTLDEFKAECEPTEPTEPTETGNSLIDAMNRGSYQSALWQYQGAKQQFDADAAVYAEKLEAYNKAVAEYPAKALAANKPNAVYVIPQAITAGTIPTTRTIGGKYNQLKEVEGMFFLIKCSIQNVANASDGVSANDTWLYDDNTDNHQTAFVLVPLRKSDYDASTNTENKDTYISEWKAGRKYVYTFYFGEQGSNAGIPVIDPGDDPDNPDPEDIDPDTPDPDPDDPSVINPDSPTLRLITYSVQSILIDNWQDADEDGVNVTYNKETDSAATTESGSGSGSTDSGQTNG